MNPQEYFNKTTGKRVFDETNLNEYTSQYVEWLENIVESNLKAHKLEIGKIYALSKNSRGIYLGIGAKGNLCFEMITNGDDFLISYDSLMQTNVAPFASNPSALIKLKLA